MSVYSRVFVGATVELATNLKYNDFRKADAFIEKHPELDEYSYDLHKDAENKTVLICDGMNGRYLRLIHIDKCTDGAYLDHGSELVALANTTIPEHIVTTFAQIYKEYTGEDIQPEQIKYAMWTQWY